MPEPHIHFDAVGGAAGDMLIAALTDAFPELQPRVLADIAAVLPAGATPPQFQEGTSGGLRALRFVWCDRGDAGATRSGELPFPVGERAGVRGADRAVGPPSPRPSPERGEGEHASPIVDDDHDHHHHGEGHEHGRSAVSRAAGKDPHGHGAGSFREMVDSIRAARLTPGTANHAVAILTAIAEVEAAIHRIAVEAVAFHEIGDWDAVVDVVAAGSLAAALAPATFSVSELPRGAGLVRTRHGFLPVPAPATAALLVGFSWRDDGIGGERVTPTGAAILRHLVGADGAGRRPAAGRLKSVGTGAGTRNLAGMPNVVRVLVFEPDAAIEEDAVAVLSFDIDDMTGEEIGIAAQRLRALPGVLDLSVGTRCGKKGRPVCDIRLLVRPQARDAVSTACLSETSTLGLRWRVERRMVLPRTASEPEAGVRTKRVTRPGGEVTVKAESDDIAGESLAARRAQKARAEAQAAAPAAAGGPRHGR